MVETVVVLWSLAFLTLIIALAKAPAWCLRPMFKHRFLRLRDDVVDDMIEGRLPRSQSVFDLIDSIEHSARVCTKVRFADLILQSLFAKDLPQRRSEMALEAALERALAGVSVDDMDEAQWDRFIDYHEQHLHQRTGAILTGSWAGLMVISWALFALMLQGLKRDEVHLLHLRKIAIKPVRQIAEFGRLASVIHRSLRAALDRAGRTWLGRMARRSDESSGRFAEIVRSGHAAS